MKLTKIGILLLSITLFSCGEEEAPKTDNASSKTMYQIDSESVTLKWTAYKTTDKIGVGGEFGKINVKDVSLSDSPEGVIDAVSFSVPVSSLFTGNTDRDWKLVNLFFGVMDQTEFIKGTFHALEGDASSGKGVMDLVMNGKTADLPYGYTIERDSMFISAKMNVLEWNGQEAMDSLNLACYDLHKGADGVSKTWSEVDIKASVAIVKK
jgi:hypothetical protein